MSPLILRCRPDAPAGAYSIGRLSGEWAPGDARPLSALLVTYTREEIDAAAAAGEALGPDNLRPLTEDEARVYVDASPHVLELVKVSARELAALEAEAAAAAAPSDPADDDAGEAPADPETAEAAADGGTPAG